MSASANQVTQVAALLRRACNVLSTGDDSSTVSATGPSVPTSSTSTATTGYIQATAVQEHRRLFGRQMRIHPYSASRTTRVARPGRSAAQRERTVTRTFVCLADKQQDCVPSITEKLRLKESGLGEKKILLPILADAEGVKAVLCNEFRPLKSCGGFELLTVKDKSRTRLEVVSYGSSSTEKIRCFGTGRIYVRPVQVDITLDESDLERVEQYEDCFLCKMPVALHDMRRHMDECGTGVNDDPQPMLETRPPENDNNSFCIESSGENESVRVGTGSVWTSESDENTDEHHQSATQPERGTATSDAVNETMHIAEKQDLPYMEHIKQAIKETLQSTAACNDPVTVLKLYASKFLRGRTLDIANEEEPCEGKTIEIFVSRQSVFSDAMTELVTTPPIEDVSYPLDVTFIGEHARDYGGPRKEFLGCTMRAIRDKLFFDVGNGEFKLTEYLTALTENHYYGAGLIFGFSILQGGPLPCFMHEEQLQKLAGEASSELNEAEKQFQLGLAKFGLLELIKKKPCLIFLLRKTAVIPLTKPKLIKLLRPRFSDEGSNIREKEIAVYRTFLEYLKEVTAGRRGSVSLEMILKFITGSESEPILGYAMEPRIEFDRYAPSPLPTSNTCINKLTLALGDNVPADRSDMYDFFDYAFTSDYFGYV